MPTSREIAQCTGVCCLLCVCVVVFSSFVIIDSINGAGAHVDPVGQSNCTPWVLKIPDRSNFTEKNYTGVIMTCGGKCQKSCGTCAFFDSCRTGTTKWCRNQCDDGEPCLYTPGTLVSDCKGICTRQYVCKKLPPLLVGTEEVDFYALLTIIYGLITFSSLVLYIVFRNDEIAELSKYLDLNKNFFVVGLAFFSASLALLYVASSRMQEEPRLPSLYSLRFIVWVAMAPVGTLLVFFYARKPGRELGRTPFLLAFLWVILFVSDISMTKVFEFTTSLERVGELHAFVEPQWKCSHVEYSMYFGSSCAFGLLTYLCANASIFCRFKDNRVLEGFFFFLGMPAVFMWVTAMAFVLICKLKGVTVLTSFAAAVSLIYMAFIAFNAHVLRKTFPAAKRFEYRDSEDEYPTGSEMSKQLHDDGDRESTDNTRYNHNSWVDVARGQTQDMFGEGPRNVPKALEIQDAVEVCLFKCCRPHMFSIIILTVQYAALGAAFWYVRNQTRKLRT